MAHPSALLDLLDLTYHTEPFYKGGDGHRGFLNKPDDRMAWKTERITTATHCCALSRPSNGPPTLVQAETDSTPLEKEAEARKQVR